MKRLTLILTILILTLTACGVASSDAAVPFTEGTVSEDGYVSKWLGLSFVPTGDIVMASSDELLGLGISMGEQAQAGTVYEMMATDTLTFSSVVIMVEAVVDELSAEEYIDALKTELDSQLDNINYSDITKKKLAGENYLRFEYGIDSYGMTLSQTMLIRKLGDRMVTVCFTYSQEAELEAFLDCFKAY